jgi:hypothetical protein
MVNPLCILPTLLLIGSTFSKCLERNEITNFGWIPLERPLKLKNPTLCQKIYSKSRACIDQANFQEFLSNIHEIMLEKKTKKYTELHDIIEDLSKKFILLQRKLLFRFTYKGKEITKNAREKIDEVVPFLPKMAANLRKKILVNQKNCLSSQMKVIIGSYCILSSENAIKSPYKNFSKKKVKSVKKFITQDLGLSEKSQKKKNFYGLRIEEKTADKIIKSCFPYVKGLCLFKKVLRALDELENFNRSSMLTENLCDEKILECKNSSKCSSQNKNKILELIFGKKGEFQDIKPQEMNWLKRVLNLSSWFEYFKESFISTKSSLTKNSTQIYDKVKYYLEILERNTIDLFVEGEKGIDLFVEGENSGINIESSEVLSIVLGLCFIVLQLFF